MMKPYIIAGSSINPLSDGSVNAWPDTLPQADGNRLRCKEPDYKNYIEDAGARRRMSRAVKMGVAAAMQCLSASRRPPDAIITATGLGCMGDTEKFLRNIIDNDEQLLNPTPFIQSTFNTVGAQVAIGLKNTHYNMTYVHRNFSFESALLDGMMRLKDQEAENILVGSYEETTDTSFRIMERLGYWRHGAISGEGAHFFMLSAKPNTAADSVLQDVLCVEDTDPDSVRRKLSVFLEKNNLCTTDIGLLLTGKNGNPKSEPFYLQIEESLRLPIILPYKRYLGDYQTTSAGALWLAVQAFSENTIPEHIAPSGNALPENHALIYDCFQGKSHAFMLIEKKKQP